MRNIALSAEENLIGAAREVAAALEAGCQVLYSEDFQHGHAIDGLRIQNPFAECF